MMNEPYIEELLQRCASLPYGRELHELLDRALEAAEQAGDEPAEYRVRLLLADACAMSGDGTGLLANFRWCLDRHERDPQRYASDPGDGADLLWQYKWVIAVFNADPQVAAGELADLLEQMSGHYRRAGLGRAAVHTARFEVAFANGWLEQAAALHEQLKEADAQDGAYCESCVDSLRVAYLYAIGNDARALDLLDRMLAHDAGCGREPAAAIAISLLPLLRAGRGSQTKALHVRGYQAICAEPENLGLVAHHLCYLVATGNLDRALFLAERHLPWLAHDPLAQREHLAFLAALGLLCTRLTEQGLGDLVLHGSQAPELAEFLGSRHQPAPLHVLGHRARDAAYRLAARFDQRNANDWTTRGVDAVVALEAGDWPLPWAEDPWLAVHRPPPAPVNGAGHLRRARELAACGHVDAALQDVLQGLDPAPSADVACGLHQLGMILSLGAGNEQLAAEHLERYLQALDRAGHRPLADLLETHGLDLHRDGTPEQLAALRRAHQAGSEDPFTNAYVGTWLAHAHMRHDRFDTARELCEATRPQILRVAAERAGDDVRDALAHNYYSIRIVLASEDADSAALHALVPAWRKYNPTDCSLAQVRFFLAQLDAEAQQPEAPNDSGEPDTALQLAEQALAVFIAYGDRARAIAAADFTAGRLLAAGRLDRAKERLRLGLHHAELAESDQQTALRYRLAQLHVECGEPHAAHDYLDAILADAGDQLGPAEHAQVLDLVGDGHGIAEQFGPAAEAWAQARSLFQGAGHTIRALQTCEKLVNVMLLTGQFPEARRLAEDMVGLGRSLTAGQGLQPELDALLLLATVQEANDEPEAAASFDAAAALADAHDQPQLRAQVLLQHAQWAGSTGQTEQAVSLMLQAAELFERLEQPSDAAQGIGAAASYLGRADRHEEAVLLFDQALGLPLENPGAERTLRLRLADSLEALHRPEQAAVQRRIANAPGA